MRRVVTVGVMCGVLGACLSAPARVPLEGEAGALRELAGEWSGDYEGVQSGRSGSIVFRISAAGDSAAGDVVMVPRATVPAGDAALPVAAAMPEPLRIAFVRVAQRVVRGELATYRDPECGCTLSTVFTGTVRGDVMEGTFVTVHLDTGLRQTGRWRVRRHGG